MLVPDEIPADALNMIWYIPLPEITILGELVACDIKLPDISELPLIGIERFVPLG